MENLTCELNGIKYLLVEVIMTHKQKDEILIKLEKYNCIIQGIKEINIKTRYAILKVLVPEINVIEFNNYSVRKDNSSENKSIIFIAIDEYIKMCCTIGDKIKSKFN